LFDCALHFRFLQKATEAMFEMGQASVAATLACQRQVCDELTRQEPTRAEPVKMGWVPDWTALTPRPLRAAQPDLIQPWLAMASACSAFWTSSALSSPAPTPTMFGVPPAVQAFWGVSPWSIYQGPMIATMLSYGVPYAVAAPTARASTSAMDAADAACAQWRLVFASAEGQKSLQRTAAATGHPWSSFLLH
jgi:hypothetical protein